MELLVKDVSKNYGQVQALKHIKLTMNEGVYGLLGPNGAGKTTLLKCLSSELEPSRGMVSFQGRNIFEMGRDYRSHLGYMPQQQTVYGEYTGRLFLRYMAALKGLDKSHAKRRIEELLDAYNLWEVAHKKIKTYSGGMRQRLLLVQALLNNPSILLLDEPTVGVDPDERIKIRNYISELATTRIVLLSTHIVSDLSSTASELVMLRRGEIIAQGRLDTFVKPLETITYEVTCEMDQLENIKNAYPILSISHLGRQVKVRVISHQKPDWPHSTLVMPSIEDAYLYYISLGVEGDLHDRSRMD